MNGYYHFSMSFVISSMSIKDGCYYCGDEADTWDHIVPRKRGGKSTYSNLVPCCRLCNSRKNARTLSDFRKSLREHGLKSDFDTPDPHAIHGTFYNGYDKSGKIKVKFVSDDGSIILEDVDIFDRVYGGDDTKSNRDKVPDDWKSIKIKIEI